VFVYVVVFSSAPVYAHTRIYSYCLKVLGKMGRIPERKMF